MTIYNIYKYGASILREKSEEVKNIDDEIRQIVSNMFQTMWSYDGIGLAANQVGIAKRIIIIDVSHYIPDFIPTALINPEIIETEGEIVMEEGCLSVPGIYEELKRPEKIKVKFQTVENETQVWECGGILSRAIQHEIDHLNGVLFPDLLTPVKRKMLSGKLKDISKGIPVGKNKSKVT